MRICFARARARREGWSFDLKVRDRVVVCCVLRAKKLVVVRCETGEMNRYFT